VLLHDGYLVDIPGYQLRFELPNTLPSEQDELIELEELDDIPEFFYTPNLQPPPSCPLMSNLIEERDAISMWSEGITTLRVADIIEETYDVKTFRFCRRNPAIVLLQTRAVCYFFIAHQRQYRTTLLQYFFVAVPSSCDGSHRKTGDGWIGIQLVV